MINRRLGLLAALAIILIAADPASALPRYSLLTGTRCSACHFNPQGSGIRNELGWSSMNQVGAIGLDSLLGEQSTNTFFDGLLTIGFDGRAQIAKQGHTPDADREIIFPMQFAPAVAFTPSEMLSIFGTYNAGPIRYAGQTSFDVQALFQPGVTLPSLRVGYFQPSVGIRHDDHTMFLRREASTSSPSPLLAPNYNELGGEITYEGQRWLTLNVGVFSAHNLHKVQVYSDSAGISVATSLVDSSKPSISARAILWPQLLDDGINMELGASILANGDFKMINAFGGLGLAEKATIYVEGMYARSANLPDGKLREIRNVMVQGSYQLWQWLALEWRYEWGQTEFPTEGPSNRAQAFIMGAQFFPIPYVELRPEYRYYQNADYLQGQYTLQMHLFY
jgi:hypothetical protein